jgi:hypothetical protein
MRDEDERRDEFSALLLKIWEIFFLQKKYPILQKKIYLFCRKNTSLKNIKQK